MLDDAAVAHACPPARTVSTYLVKMGTGTLSLSGAGSSYNGNTQVLNGILTVLANAPSGANGALVMRRDLR